MKIILIMFVIISVINIFAIMYEKACLIDFDLIGFSVIDKLNTITRVMQILLSAVIIIIFIVRSNI